MMPRVGIIGLDRRGASVAHRLAGTQPDLALTVYDPLPERCEPFRGYATLALNAAEALREADALILALPNEHEVDRTLERFSDGAVAADIAGKLLLDLSPLNEAQARKLRAAVAVAGGLYLHARHDKTHVHALALLQPLFDERGRAPSPADQASVNAAPASVR